MGLLLRDARGVALLPWCHARRDPRLPQHGGQGGGRAPVFVAPFATGTEATCTSCGGDNRAQNREKDSCMAKGTPSAARVLPGRLLARTRWSISRPGGTVLRSRGVGWDRPPWFLPRR